MKYHKLLSTHKISICCTFEGRIFFAQSNWLSTQNVQDFGKINRDSIKFGVVRQATSDFRVLKPL